MNWCYYRGHYFEGQSFQERKFLFFCKKCHDEFSLSEEAANLQIQIRQEIHEKEKQDECHGKNHRSSNSSSGRRLWVLSESRLSRYDSVRFFRTYQLLLSHQVPRQGVQDTGLVGTLLATGETQMRINRCFFCEKLIFFFQVWFDRDFVIGGLYSHKRCFKEAFKHLRS